MVQATRRDRRIKRHFRARKKLFGSTERPRLVISRTNKHISAQVINDEESKTLCSIGSYSKDLKGKIKGYDIAGAQEVGKAIAEKAKATGVGKVVCDTGGNLYHGRVKALAEAARKAGLDF
jgi:large subunit ribosomal protein L18